MLHACLYTIFFVFCYTSWRFYAFSITNLLTRCHSVSSLFSAVFVFEKSYTGNILGIGRNKSQSSYFSWSMTESKQRWRGARRRPRHPMARATPRPRQGMVWAPGPPPDAALLPIYSPRWENLKAPINFHETYCKPPPPSMWDREGPEALIDTLSERGITTRGLLHHLASLRSDVWVVYLGLWVHSSS
jgi:hypothetical protein